MSVREIRLCDKPLCDGKFEALCGFCGVECCSHHIGDDKIIVLLQLAYGLPQEIVLGECYFRVCRDCSRGLNHSRIGGPPSPDRFVDHEVFRPAVEQVFKARLAANALTQEGKNS